MHEEVRLRAALGAVVPNPLFVLDEREEALGQAGQAGCALGFVHRELQREAIRGECVPIRGDCVPIWGDCVPIRGSHELQRVAIRGLGENACQLGAVSTSSGQEGGHKRRLVAVSGNWWPFAALNRTQSHPPASIARGSEGS